MAALGMRDIKRRIKSVNSTKQITKAMELVSSAKFRKIREELEHTKPYFNALEKTVQDIFTNTKGIDHVFVNQRPVNKSVYIVAAADRGLCGGYNANVIKEALGSLNQRDNKSLVAIGTKVRDYFQKRGYELAGQFVHVSEKPTYSLAQQIGRLALDLYQRGEADEVYLVFSEFVSTMTQKPKTIKLLPLEVSGKAETETEKKGTTLMTYEPSPEGVLDYLVPKYIEGMIYGALVEAATSEQAARRVAMESATDSAEEMIDSLKLQYNRARQASITQQITEIVGGAEALK